MDRSVMRSFGIVITGKRWHTAGLLGAQSYAGSLLGLEYPCEITVQEQQFGALT